MSRELAPEEADLVDDMLKRARVAMSEVEHYSQEQLDRLAQAIGWYAGNEATFTRLAQLGVDESGIGVP